MTDWNKLTSWRYRSYKRTDKRDGLKCDITLEEARQFFKSACHYCGIVNDERGIGIDRKSNFRGHETLNCVPSCSNCNYILGTLPYSVKKLFRNALRVARKKKLLKNWKPVNGLSKRD